MKKIILSILAFLICLQSFTFASSESIELKRRDLPLQWVEISENELPKNPIWEYKASYTRDIFAEVETSTAGFDYILLTILKFPDISEFFANVLTSLLYGSDTDALSGSYSDYRLRGNPYFRKEYAKILMRDHTYVYFIKYSRYTTMH